MRRMRIACLGLLVVILSSVAACEKAGYRITIGVPSLGYSDVQELETALTERGFQLATYRTDKGDMIPWRERRVGFPRYPDEVYTLLVKRLDNKDHFWIHVYINYVRDSPRKTTTHVEIWVENMYAGLILPEVKAGIDDIGDLIYQELENVVGRENVKIERKEVSPPAFY